MHRGRLGTRLTRPLALLALCLVMGEGIAIARPTIIINTGRGGYSGIGIPAPSQIHPIYDNYPYRYYGPGVTRFYPGFGHTYFQTNYRRYGQFYYAYPPYWWQYYQGRYYSSWSRRWGSTYARPPIIGMPVWRDPAEMDAERAAQDAERAAANAPPVIEIDEALVALRAHDYATAAARYRARDEQRNQALALVGANEIARAVEVFVEAYKGDADLVRQPMNALGMVGTRGEMRRIVTRAVRYAHQVKTAEAWFTVAVLMQGEGRDETARQMLQRAREAEAEGRGAIPKAEPRPAAQPAPPAAPTPATPATPPPQAQPTPPGTLADPDDADMGQAPRPGGVVR